MFKEGQVYKVKVELSPDLMGFGRAIVIAIDPQRIYVQLKSSKGNKLNVPDGTKIWFVGSSLNNRFNGLWASEVKRSKMINGASCLECRLPRFEEASQRRTLARSELNAPAELAGDEWKDINARVVTRNISRLGLGFYIEAECGERFAPGKMLSLLVHLGKMNLQARGRVVNCRFNWLLNHTEVGIEFSDLDATDAEAVEQVLVWLGNRPRTGKAEMSESGSLARWVKAGKDNLSFVKQSESPEPAEEIDLESLEDEIEFDTDSGLE